MLNFAEFLAWERTTSDAIDFKKIYADIADDTLAGLVLSQLVYWHMPNKNGNSRMQVQKNGHLWVACRRYDWWETTRMTPRQVDRAIKKLIDRGIIQKSTWKFDGLRTLHVRIIAESFLELWHKHLNNPPENPYCPDTKNGKVSETNLPNGETQITNSLNGFVANGETGLSQTVKPLTETTTKTTTENQKEKDSTESEESTSNTPAQDFSSKPSEQSVGEKSKPETPKATEPEQISAVQEKGATKVAQVPDIKVPQKSQNGAKPHKQHFWKLRHDEQFYNDGKRLDLLQFQIEYNNILNAYRDALADVGMPTVLDESEFWGKHGRGAVALAKLRATAEQVTARVQELCKPDANGQNWYRDDCKRPQLLTMAGDYDAWGKQNISHPNSVQPPKPQYIYPSDNLAPPPEDPNWTPEDMDRLLAIADGKVLP